MDHTLKRNGYDFAQGNPYASSELQENRAQFRYHGLSVISGKVTHDARPPRQAWTKGAHQLAEHCHEQLGAHGQAQAEAVARFGLQHGCGSPAQMRHREHLEKQAARNRRESTRTGRKKSGRHAIQRWPSSDDIRGAADRALAAV
jgi:hypothetical protein